MTRNSSRFSISVSDATLRRSANGQITGQIAINLGSVSFPESTWSDFVIVLLGWWAEALASLVSGRQSNAEWLFMDGPYRVDLRASGRENVEVRLLKGNERTDSELRFDTVPTADLIRAISEAGRSSLVSCKNRGWSSLEIIDLTSHLDHLRRASESFH